MNMEELTRSASVAETRLHLTRETPKRAAAFTVNGDCMEGKQMFNGDTVLVDLDRKPRPGDPCLCIVRGTPLFKVFHATMGKSAYTVGTCYRLNESRPLNRGLIASEIGGVVIGCFDEAGEPRWMNDYRSYPEELPGAVESPKSNARFAFGC